MCETAGLGAFSRQIQAKTKRARRITRQAPFLSHPHRPDGTAAPRTPLPQCRLTARRANRPPDGFRGRPAAAPHGGAGRRRPCGPRLSPQILLFRGAYRSSQCCTRPMALSQPRRLRSRTSAAILGVYSLSSVHCSRISSKSFHTPVASPAR